MAENITIAQLDIDTDKLLDRQALLLKQIKELKKELSEATAKTKESGDATALQAKDIELLKYNITILNKEYAANKKVLVETTTTANAYNDALKREVNTINEARTSNKELIAVRNNLSTATEEGRAKIEKINAKIDQNNKLIKSNVSGLEKQKIEIGSYASGVIKAAEALGIEGKSMQLVTNLANRLGKTEEQRAMAQEAANTATSKSVKAFNLLKVAIASTGIGLLVVALGSLIAYFQRTEEGGDKLKVILAAVGNVANQLMEPLVKLGKTIVQVFSNPQESIKKFGDLIKQNIQNRFEGAVNVVGSAAKAIKAFFKGDWDEAWESAKDIAWSAQQVITGVTKEGWEEVGEAVADYGKNLVNTTKQAVNLQERENQLHKDNRDWLVQKKNLENQIVDLKRTSQDQTKSLSEREEAATKALELQEQIRQRDIELAQEEYELIKNKNALASSNTKDLDAEAAALAKVNQVAFDGGQKTIELNNQLNAIRKEAATEEAARQKEAAAQEVRRAENELRLFEAQQERLRLSKKNQELNYAEQLAQEEEFYERKKAIDQAALNAGEIDQEEYNMRLLELENEHIANLNEINENERERRKEQEEVDFEAQLLKAEDDYERRQMELDRQREQELANENLTAEQKELIEQNYADASKKIQKEKETANLNAAADALGAVSELLGENTVASKLASVAQATINTYLAASQTLADPTLPFFAKVAGVATTIATGLAQVVKISGVQIPKFEHGGSFIVGGRRHFEGGTRFYGTDGSMFEAERGEMITITSREKTAAYFRNISASNVSIGGRDIRSMMPSGYGTGITKSEKQSDRPIVVKVVDIVDGVEQRTEVVDEATI